MRNCAIIHPLHLELETAPYNPLPSGSLKQRQPDIRLASLLGWMSSRVGRSVSFI
jgi:hypothetical protein